MSDSVSSDGQGGYSMGVSASDGSGGATAAPSGNGDNGGGIGLGSDGSGAGVISNNGVLSVIDPVTGVAVTIATVNPPLALPPIHITIYSPVNPTDPQWAKQEASLIANLTTAALTRAGGRDCSPASSAARSAPLSARQKASWRCKR